MKQLAEPGKHHKPRRYTLDRLTNAKIVKRENNRKTNQEAEDFAKTVMGWIL